MITVFLEVLSIALIIPFMSVILSPEKIIPKINSLILEWEIDFTQLDLTDLENAKYILIICFFLVYLIKNCFILATKYLELKFFKDVEKEISLKILKRYFQQRYSFFIEKNSSVFISRLTHDMVVLIASFVRPTIVILTEVLILISISLIIIYLQLFQIFLIFASIFIIGIIILKLTTSNIKKLGHERMIYDQKRLNSLKAFFKNANIIILDQQFNSIKKYYREIVDKLTNFKKISDFTLILPKYLFEVLGILAVCTIIIYLSINSYDTEYILSSVAFFLAVAYRFLPSIQKTIYSLQSLSYGRASLKAILYDLQLETKNVSLETNAILDFRNHFTLKDITFSYKDRNEKIFDKANLKIKKGSSIGIFGNSGVGKSTLIDIVVCLKELESGSIFVDDKDINNKQDEIRAWQNKISYISQETFLFDDKIINNICSTSFEKKEINKQKFNEVISIAKLEKFINNLPDKENSKVGDESVKISGGQRKRIAIARALYKEPELLVLDEATNGLDQQLENEIIDTVLELRKNITVIIISHNRHVISKCRDIYEIKNKKIIKIN